ncbi:MAG TPA: hypothetical protein VMR48_06475 [Gaiellaceae bacterium]|nr:hypothetical protein [Gaiellaceae bacterium]
MTTPLESQRALGEGRGDGRPVRSELLREVNNRIREVGREGDLPNLEFVCECGNGGCVDVVELSAGDYDRIRKTSGLVLAAGHVTV